jgi:hypothetical protein
MKISIMMFFMSPTAEYNRTFVLMNLNDLNDFYDTSFCIL